MLTGHSTVATTDASGAVKFSAVRTGPVRATGYGYNTNSLNTTIVERTDGVETQRWTLAYNASGDLTRITDVTGGNQTATLTNDAHGRLTRLVASNGALATFGANSRGQMITANTPSGSVSYVYDARNLINEIRFGDGRWVRYSYSAAQKLIEIRDSSGLVEVIAAGESEGLDPQRLALRVAQWLADRGDRVAQMLVPQAHAQPQVLLMPVAIVWGLMATAEGQRNNANGPGKPGSGCCGDGGASAGGASGKPSSWLSRIGNILWSESSVPRPPNMDRLEERAWDRHCVRSDDPCATLKAATSDAIKQARSKMLAMQIDRDRLFGTAGWTTHANDLIGRINNIQAMISLGYKIGCDMSQEARDASSLFVPPRPNP